jgi:hypothetical protein
MSMSAYLRMILEVDIAAHAWDDWASTHGVDSDERADADQRADPDDAVAVVRATRVERGDEIDDSVGS